MSENKITFPVKLASNNPKSFGIVDATEISGHRSVETLSELYAISDSILSILKDGSDAIGQEWFVVSEDCKYRLDNWENRKSVSGWTKLPKQELIDTKQSVSEKDQPNGYAGLDSNGKLPIEKTYGATATVVDVATYESLPVTGLSGVIYYVSSTSAQYKWSGSAYIDITDGADNAKKNETSIFDCSNGTSTKYYSSLSAAINVVPPVYRTSNRIISYLSTESVPTSAMNYQFHGIDSTTWTDLTKWERLPNQADLAEIRSDLIQELTELGSEVNGNYNNLVINKPFVSNRITKQLSTIISLKNGDILHYGSSVATTILIYEGNTRIAELSSPQGDFIYPYSGVARNITKIELYDASNPSYNGTVTLYTNEPLSKQVEDHDTEITRINNDVNLLKTKVDTNTEALLTTDSNLKKLATVGASVNLFNKNDSSNVSGAYINGNTIATEQAEKYHYSHIIPITKGKKYTFSYDASFGLNGQRLYICNTKGVVLTFLKGTASTDSRDNTIYTVDTSSVLIDSFVARVNYTTSIADTFMIVEGDASKYPNEYVAFGEEKALKPDVFVPSILTDKKVIFDGDSISYGANDSVGRGWGSRIGERNKMNWQNVSVSGGTISIVSGKHNLCTYIDTIHANNPTLDYFVFDGGTNDADNICLENIGEIATVNYGGQEYYDFSGNYDTSTFCGAFETLLYKVFQYYPNIKIGYIVAPKMGVYSASLNMTILPKVREQFFNKAKEICMKWGVPYLDLWNGCILNPCNLSHYDRNKTAQENIDLGHPYSVDSQHPNFIGYDMITPMIEAWMKTL